MQEFSVPEIHAVKPGDNVTGDVLANAEHWADAVGLKRKVNGAWTSVPQLWEKASHSVRDQAAASGHGKVFTQTEATAIAYSRALDTGGLSLALRLQHALFDGLVYARLRATLGGRVRYVWSAAAPLSPRLGPLLPRVRYHRPGGLRHDQDQPRDQLRHH